MTFNDAEKMRWDYMIQLEYYQLKNIEKRMLSRILEESSSQFFSFFLIMIWSETTPSIVTFLTQIKADALLVIFCVSKYSIFITNQLQFLPKKVEEERVLGKRMESTEKNSVRVHKIESPWEIKENFNRRKHVICW